MCPKAGSASIAGVGAEAGSTPPQNMPIPGQCLEWEPRVLWGPRRALPAGCVVLQEAEVGPHPRWAWASGGLPRRGRAVTQHVLAACSAPCAPSSFILISEGRVSELPGPFTKTPSTSGHTKESCRAASRVPEERQETDFAKWSHPLPACTCGAWEPGGQSLNSSVPLAPWTFSPPQISLYTAAGQALLPPNTPLNTERLAVVGESGVQMAGVHVPPVDAHPPLVHAAMPPTVPLLDGRTPAFC